MRDPIDISARRYRLLRDARIRQIADAFASSPAIITTDTASRRELVLMTDDPLERGSRRVTYLAKDGPRGHFTSASHRALIEHVADGYPVHARPATDADVIVWTSTPEYADGARRVLEVQRANEARR